MKDVSEFLQASRKCRTNRENWYADELLELVTHIQEHAKNKDITKAEYCKMLDGVSRRANLIKEKMLEDIGTWSSPVPDSVVENSERRSKLWSELIEKYPDDEELKNISMEELSTKNEWFEKYGVKLRGSQ